MLDTAVNARIARDLSARQFAAARGPEPEATAPRAPVRRSLVLVLRRLADRLDPVPRCVPQS
jgi:hypothetical protein